MLVPPERQLDDTSSSSSSRRRTSRIGTSRRSRCWYGPEFHMSDAGAGMLNGAAFVFIYVLATIPLARTADMRSEEPPGGESHRVVHLTSLSGLSRIPQLSSLAGHLPGRGGVHPRGAVSHRHHVRSW